MDDGIKAKLAVTGLALFIIFCLIAFDGISWDGVAIIGIISLAVSAFLYLIAGGDKDD